MNLAPELCEVHLRRMKMASDQSVVTVKNISTSRVVIGGKYLMPNEARRVRRVEYDTAKRLYPNAVTLVLEERGAMRERGRESERDGEIERQGDVEMHVVASFVETREDGAVERFDVVAPPSASSSNNEIATEKTRAGRRKRAQA